MDEVIAEILQEIKAQIKSQVKSKKEDEDIRKEVVDTYAKLAELKTKRDTEIYEIQAGCNKKIEETVAKFKAEFAENLQKEEEKVAQLQLQLLETKKREAEFMKEIEKGKTFEANVEQVKGILEDTRRQLNLHTMEENSLREKFKKQSDRVGDLEYQIAVVKDQAYKVAHPLRSTDKTKSKKK